MWMLHNDSLHHTILIRRDTMCQNIGETCFIIRRRDGRGKSPENHAFTFRPWLVERFSGGDMGNPALYDALINKKRRAHLDLSVKNSRRTANYPAETAASEQCHPCHQREGVTFLASEANTFTSCAWLSRDVWFPVMYFLWMKLDHLWWSYQNKHRM